MIRAITHVRNRALFCLALATITPSALAMFMGVTEQQLLAQSSVVVVGELMGRAEIATADGAAPINLGVIRVERMLKGDPDTTILFLALPRRGPMPRLSTDIDYRDGQRGLWFLHLRDPAQSGVFLADHPQRFVPINKAEERIPAVLKLLGE